MLLLSKTSRAPRSLASSAAMARPSRYSRSRAKSTRSSKSTPIRPGAGASGRAGTGGIGAPWGLLGSGRLLRAGCAEPMYSLIKRHVQCGCQGAGVGRPTMRLRRLGSRNADPAKRHRQPSYRCRVWGESWRGPGRLPRRKTERHEGPERHAAFDPGAQLGPRLRRVREERGLSVRELARRISCSPSLISQIERGLSAPSVGILYAIATSCGHRSTSCSGRGRGSDAGDRHGDGHRRLAGTAPEGAGNGTGSGWPMGTGGAAGRAPGGRSTWPAGSGGSG